MGVTMSKSMNLGGSPVLQARCRVCGGMASRNSLGQTLWHTAKDGRGGVEVCEGSTRGAKP